MLPPVRTFTHCFYSGADIIDTVKFLTYCLVTKFVNAETAKTFKHLTWMVFLFSYFSINFCKLFSFLLIFQHIFLASQRTHEISEDRNVFFCLTNPVIVFKINVNSSVLLKYS